jgi:hypothetical protein
LASDRSKRTLRFNLDSSWGATVQAGAGGGVAVEVESLTLPEILQTEPVALIYCNAEGAEYALVPQLREREIRPPVMVLCVHPEYGNADQLRADVRSMGYVERDVSDNPQRPACHYTRTNVQ